jgi:TonB-linked SusC/RagA family outer membrane protein
VNILVVGTSTGAATDSKGHYSVSVPSLQDTLRFSFIGYQAKAVPINERTTIDVALKSQVISGQQLVVIALGRKGKKRSLSYSSTQIKVRSIKKIPQPNIINSLEGKVAGLTINQTGGGIGSGSYVNLRGNRSITGSNKPLYIVDGVPTLNEPQYLTADNIASINVLKGANGAALYGSKAQNGVIIITTKKAQQGKTTININNSFMLNDAKIGIPFQNKYAQGTKGNYNPRATKAWGPKMQGQEVKTWSLDPADAGNTYALEPQPNSRKDLFRLGYNLTNNVQIGLGNNKFNGIFSITSLEGKGVIPNNELKRRNIMLKLGGNNYANNFHWNSKLNFTRQNRSGIPLGGTSSFNPIQLIYMMPPNIRLKNAKNYEFINPSGKSLQNFWGKGAGTALQNPYWFFNNDNINEINSRVNGLISFTYNFTKSLSIRVRSSYDQLNSNEQKQYHNDTFVRAPDGKYSVTRNTSYIFNSDFLFNYKKSFGSNWNVKVGLGGNLKKKNNSIELGSNSGRALLLPNFFTMSNTNDPIVSSNHGVHEEKQSLYFIGNANWKEAIYLHLTGRNDWTSTLPKNSRSYFYPSVGISVIPTSLFNSVPNFLNFLKLRFSWAKVGSSPGAYKTARKASLSPGGNDGFLSIGSVLPDKNLKPEKTISREGGINIRFINDRLGLNFTYYQTNTKNQLFTIALPIESGAKSKFKNGGNVEVKGVEWSLNSTPVENKNLKWDLNLLFSHMKNKVISISDQRPKIILNGPSTGYFSDYVVKQGMPFGEMFSRGFKRDDQGRVIVDSNGIPLITNGRSVDLGHYTPKWLGSLSTILTYKNLSLSILIKHRQGGHVLSYTRARLDQRGLSKRSTIGRDGKGLIFGKNIFRNYNAVNQDGSTNNIAIDPQTFWGVVGYVNVGIGEAYNYSATNTRVKEMSLSYNLPHSLFKNTPLSNVEVSLVGRNLFFIHRATPGLDPSIIVSSENSAQGFTQFAPPIIRTYGMNINIKF